MRSISFEWDERKNRSNSLKHKITFEEAKSAFSDPHGRIIHDPDHSKEDEDRYILLGLSDDLKILIVCHCYRNRSGTIRIISARKANRHEKLEYERLLK